MAEEGPLGQATGTLVDAHVGTPAEAFMQENYLAGVTDCLRSGVPQKRGPEPRRLTMLPPSELHGGAPEQEVLTPGLAVAAQDAMGSPPACPGEVVSSPSHLCDREAVSLGRGLDLVSEGQEGEDRRRLKGSQAAHQPSPGEETPPRAHVRADGRSRQATQSGRRAKASVVWGLAIPPDARRVAAYRL